MAEYNTLKGSWTNPSNQTNLRLNDDSNKSQISNHKGFFCVLLAIALVIVFLLLLPADENIKRYINKSKALGSVENCNIHLVESIPEGLIYTPDSPKFMSTYEAWHTLLNKANKTIDIAALYWTLRGADVVNHTSAAEGEEIFKQILSNGATKKLKIRIAQNMATDKEPNIDSDLFAKAGAAKVRNVDFSRLLGGGVLHTKLWIVDNQHFYVGSANMDWRSLTQVKELGVLGINCSAIVEDISKIFRIYWFLGQEGSFIPEHWPNTLSTPYNWANPMLVKYNENYVMSTFISSSPPPFSPNGRTDDINAILHVIASANSFVYISVMDYFPLFIYSENARYWPLIDDALKAAAINRNITVKMLISWWKHSRPSEDYFLRSLTSLSSSFEGVHIEIKRFLVPSNEDQDKIPFSRVNHNKYMVTDNTAYIGTSNWSADYFTDTAGIGFVLRDTATNGSTSNGGTLRLDLLSVFNRDWESPYAVNLQNEQK